MKMHFIYFFLAVCATIAGASPVLEDRVGLSSGPVKARKLIPATANERRQVEYGNIDAKASEHEAKRRGLSSADPKDKRQWDWFYDEDDFWDDYFGDFDMWVSENTAKRRDLQPSGPKDKRQVDGYYDEDEYYDDWVGDFDGGVSENAAKARA